jgi:hypothetical protein
MLHVLADTDPLEILYDQVIKSMIKMGPSVMEPALRAASNAGHDLKDSLAAILSRIGFRDERILEMLLDQLRRNPAYAGNLANYGDPTRFLPYFRPSTSTRSSRTRIRFPTTRSLNYARPSRSSAAT